MQPYSPLMQRALLFGLLITLLFLGFSILKYFISPLLWAAIIAYVTWPIYLLINRLFGTQRSNLNASIMISLIILIIGIPLTFAIFTLKHEGRYLLAQLQNQIFSGHFDLPQFIYETPIIGKEVSRLIYEINHNPQTITQNLSIWIQSQIGYGRYVLGEISKNLMKFSCTILSLFFFYRDGPKILHQISEAIEMIIGPRVHHYLETISKTTRAVVYGVGLTAVAQALLAGLSYFIAGVPSPLVLTIITFLLALIPFGTPVAYTSVALWLVSQGHMLGAFGVMAWGICIVSTSDNVIRPLVISGATRIPFLLIMFGVLGGLASFGLVGLFVGPVILAVLLAIWREWLHKNVDTESNSEKEEYQT